MKIISWAGILIGTPSVIYGYLLNSANWKNDVIFLVGLSFWIPVIIYGAIKRHDEMIIRRRQMKAQQRNEEWEEKIRNMYGPDDNHRLFN